MESEVRRETDRRNISETFCSNVQKDKWNQASAERVGPPETRTESDPLPKREVRFGFSTSRTVEQEHPLRGEKLWDGSRACLSLMGN